MTDPSPTRALYLVKLLEALQGRGRDVTAWLRDSGLSPGELRNRDATVSLERYVHVVDCALARYDIPDLGFLVGERTRMTEHGVLGYALLSAPDLGRSLERYVLYQYLQGPLLSVELEYDDTAAWLLARPLDCVSPAPGVLRYALQEWLVGWNQWNALIGRRGAFFDRVEIGFDGESHAQLYRRHLGCPVSFGAPLTRAWFPRAHLKRALDYSDEGIAAMCAEQCEHILRHLDLGHGLVAEVYRHLSLVPGRLPRMDEVARRLHIDERTLRRRLLKAGVCYRDIVIAFRMALAKRYLAETALPANEIAALVGYADSGNFYRTFRRQFATTPGRFRRRSSLVRV